MFFTGNERFLLAFPSSLLSGYALNKQTGHGRERDLNTRSIFSLPRVVRSINIQYLPHPHRDTSPFRWRNISPCHKFQKKCTRRKQQYSFRIPTSNLRKARYLNTYLRFALINLFYISISFSPVILKGTINPQSSENKILEYSS